MSSYLAEACCLKENLHLKITSDLRFSVSPIFGYVCILTKKVHKTINATEPGFLLMNANVLAKKRSRPEGRLCFFSECCVAFNLHILKKLFHITQTVIEP